MDKNNPIFQHWQKWGQQKKDDFKSHMTAVFQRSMPITDLNPTDFRPPSEEEWQDFLRRLDVAAGVYGAEAVSILRNSGATSVEKTEFAGLRQAYINRTGRSQFFDPDKMDWKAAAAAAAKVIDTAVELNITIQERGGLSPQERYLLAKGRLTL